jgi:hypothetical protein
VRNAETRPAIRPEGDTERPKYTHASSAAAQHPGVQEEPIRFGCQFLTCGIGKRFSRSLGLLTSEATGFERLDELQGIEWDGSHDDFSCGSRL